MIVIYFLLLIYCSFFLILIVKNKKTKSFPFKESIDLSILIPFRNEKDNLLNLVECIKAQEYKLGKTEFLFINDHSTDSGSKILLEAVKGMGQFESYLIDLPIGQQGKKEAIHYGLGRAKYEYIIQLDADVHFGAKFLTSVAQCFQKKGISLILGRVAMNRGKNLLGIFQQNEFLGIMALTFFTAKLNMPVLANGANIAYTKQFYSRAEQYRSDWKIASGDDIFLLHAAKKIDKEGILFNNDYEGQVVIEPEQNVKALLDQRIRWAKKTKYFNDTESSLIGLLVFALNIGILTALFGVLINRVSIITFFTLFIIKWVVDVLLILSFDPKRASKRLVIELLGLSFIYPVYVSGVALLSLLYRPNWKGREIE